MAPIPSLRQLLLLSACSTGLSCSAVFSNPLPAPQAAEPATPALETLQGTKAAGSSKESPFAGAKETDAATRADLRIDRTRLWWLLLPVGLAAISYGALRSQEGSQD